MDAFHKEWLGKRVDVDRFPKGAIYQCTDIVKQYLKDVHGIAPATFGNAIEYWTRTSPAILKKFVKVPRDANNAQAGDIVVIQGKWNNPYGHLMIAVDDKLALEQNGGRGTGTGTGTDAIRTRAIPYDRVAGYLRPISSAPIAQVTNRTYTVQKGDYLIKIAHKFGMRWQDLYNHNKAVIGPNPNLIKAGQVLRLP